MKELIQRDLAISGLEASDLRIRQISHAELAATATSFSSTKPLQGYVIPYYNIDGAPIPFYRIKLFDMEPKYKQPKDTSTHLYYPPAFKKSLQGQKYVIITEGEKKAAAATKFGFPTVGLGGTDSWRNRTLMLPGDIKLETGAGGKTIKARLPDGDFDIEFKPSTLAVGLQELIDYCVAHKLCIIIIYDSDHDGVKPAVQSAAARLGHELRHRGVATNNIRQVILPTTEEEGKKGLDDYLTQASGARGLRTLIQQAMTKRTAFPRFPDARAHINKLLQRPKLSRKECAQLSLVIILEMEALGVRMKTPDTGQLHYFDEESYRLLPVDLLHTNATPLHEMSFGIHLYRKFGVSTNDRRIVEWLATQFTGEPGIVETKTYKVLTRVPKKKDEIALQLSDSKFVVVSGSSELPIVIHNNGSCGILFEQGQVDAISPTKLIEEYRRQARAPLQNVWLEIMHEMNFRSAGEHITIDQSRILASLLFYVSPWLNRWRGSQMPVELIVGEAGSGKSSLYGLRQYIISGQMNLSNLTNDIRDWYASVSAVGGLHILDNIHFSYSAKDAKQRLSDEICRLITEPYPHVELRKLYTTSKIVKVSIDPTFALTAIDQPFKNTDFIQRSAIFELNAIKTSHDSDWRTRQFKRFRSREGWIAHHLLFLHKFLHLVETHKWKSTYASNHRLAHYEQNLVMAASIFGHDTSWIPSVLSTNTQDQVSLADWTLKGLAAFVSDVKMKNPGTHFGKRFTCKDIGIWASQQPTFATNNQMTNAWSLTRYIKSHESLVKSTTGLEETSPVGNRKAYHITPKGA